MILEPGYYSDGAVAYYLQNSRLPEPEVYDVMVRLIKPGDTVVDAGANIGFFSLIMAALVGPTGTVLAFEPSQRNARKLLVNKSLNGAQQIIVHEKALTDKIETAMLFLHNEDNGQDSLYNLNATNQAQYVSAVTLEKELEDYDPTFIKIDIEGSELNALHGLKKHPKAITCEINIPALDEAGTSMEEVFDCVRSMGYDIFLIRYGQFPTLVPPGVELRLVRRNANILFSTLPVIAQGWPLIEEK